MTLPQNFHKYEFILKHLKTFTVQIHCILHIRAFTTGRIKT